MSRVCNLKEFLSHLNNVDALRFLYFLKRLSSPEISISLENVRIMLQIASHKYGWNADSRNGLEEYAENLVSLFCLTDDGFCRLDYLPDIFEDYSDIVNPIHREHLMSDELDIIYVSNTALELGISEEPVFDDENAVVLYHQHLKALYERDYAEIEVEILDHLHAVCNPQPMKNNNQKKKPSKIDTQSTNKNIQILAINRNQEAFRNCLQEVIISTIKHLPNELSSEINEMVTPEITFEDILFMVIDRESLRISEKEYDKILENLVASKNTSIPSTVHRFHSLTKFLSKPCLHKVFRRMIKETWEYYLKKSNNSIGDDKYIDYRAGFKETPLNGYNLEYALRLVVHNESSFVVYAYVDANKEGSANLLEEEIPVNNAFNCSDVADIMYTFNNVVKTDKLGTSHTLRRNTYIYARILAYNINKIIEQ